MQYAAMGAQRPPSRHKDPPQNLGLDLPMEDNGALCVDEDYDSGDAFEIGLDKANKSKHIFQDEDSDDSFNRQNSSGNRGDGFEVANDINMNDFLN